MKKIIIFFVALLFTSTVFSENNTIVNIENIASDNSILENGDGVFIDIKLSNIKNSSTNITLSFLSSTAEPNIDFKLRYQATYDDIVINDNGEAVVAIPAGESSVRIFPYTLADCIDENIETINMQISNVDNNVIIGQGTIDNIAIEDNSYDDSYYYASTDGVSGNDGSCSQPFSLAIGLYYLRDNPEKTTLIIKNGTYRVTNSTFVYGVGTAEKPITIRAEYPGNVFFVGNRSETEQDGSFDYGLMIQEASHVLIKGISFINFGTGIKIYHDGNNPALAETKHITIDNCDFINNGHAGIEVTRASNIIVKSSSFIGSIPVENSVDSQGSQCPQGQLCAIQDYGINAYNSNNITIKDNLFYGRHHQAVSFKEGVNNGLVERNTFVGALYTAIYLGQNFTENSPKSENLTARYNIVMDKEGYPVKSPLRIDNVNNALVEHNYFEDFDYSNNLSGIYILPRATGNININHNIMAYGQDNQKSGAFEIEQAYGCPSINTNINISNNLLYKIHHVLSINNCSNQAILTNNKAFKLLENGPSLDAPSDPVEVNMSAESSLFDNVYQQLTQPIIQYVLDHQ